MAIQTLKDARIRLYDSAATPLYIAFTCDPGDFSAPIGVPKVEELLKLDRGNYNASAHYINGSDAPLMAPVPVSWSFPVTDAAKTTNILDWIAAMNDGLVTQVNSHTLETTETDSMRNGSVANAVFADSNKSTCILEYVIEIGGTDLGWKYQGLWIPASECMLTEGEEGIMIAVSAQCYGTITQLTIFTTGIDVEA